MRHHAPPRGLSQEESEAWAKVARTVKPLSNDLPVPPRPKPVPEPPKHPHTPAPQAVKQGRVPPAKPVQPKAPPRPALTDHGLDSHWEKRFAKGSAEPDFSLDLHGHTLDSAHRRLDQGLAQAKAMGARMVLIVTGKPRPVDSADRGQRRGAIRAHILDWLAAGPHEADIAAIRNAHRRHGGQGALYVVLRRRR